jgi:spermidine synthase
VPRLLFPALLLLFAASGCAALIYEVVWLQLLQLVIGSTAVSMAVLLSAYMGGLCAGSYLLPRVVSPQRHPLRVYAFIELGIGILAIAVLFLVPVVRYVYVAAVGLGLPGMLLRGLICGLCLLPPTLLMGASLPAMARWLQATPEGAARLGLLYGANTAGAVVGCLAAGFYLLRIFDMPTGTCVAAAINALAALASFLLASRTPAVSISAASGVGLDRSAWPVYVTIAFSGFTALGAEVVWTRLLSLLLGATVYTFAIILAVFLFGIGLGSAAGSLILRLGGRARTWLGASQCLLAVSIAWTAWIVYTSLPYWPINPELTRNPWINFQLDVVRCLWALLPATLLWGASFPLALASAAGAGRSDDAGKLAGGVYAANTVGAIVGAILFSLILIPGIGTQQSQRVLIVTAGIAAMFMLPLPRPPALASAVLAGLLAWSVPVVPWDMVAYGRRLPSKVDYGHALYVGEGMNASIVVSELKSGERVFHISGKAEASNESHDLKLERMLGHIPALTHSAPQSVLIVGFGAGVTAGSFVTYPEIKRIVICEMEPLVPPATTRFFNRENYNVLHDPRTQIVYDDARHYMLTAREKFDIITSDPIHPWVKGSATLYSKEYFELVKARLNPGGRVTQWVPLYDSDVETVKSEIATFYDSFPNGTTWDNDVIDMGYDLVMLGQLDPPHIDVEAIERRLGRLDYGRVLQSLRDVRLGSALDLVATYSGRASDIADWTRNAEINRDRNLRLQYLAGMGVDANGSFAIYYQMMSRFRYPDEVFTISDDHKTRLKKMLGVTK